ncbi:hypothetical protein PDESU_02734 [Pontiella desulfatans]|uniref:Uncharacterized protein n=1 Tax=Pontiella desulfatans TaxID=2750659 RepID=A0A6C2U2V2_PONDE|nr:hypothetical protein [Pontiella desulfatans]VGO14175.1 hypothetical protein PDESU_02734 [Pontiella desulfatans]
MKRTLAILTTVALSATLASAELVGSLNLDTNNDTNDVDRLAGFVTRTGNGNANTRGTVQGDFSLLTSVDLGVGGFTGAIVSTFSGSTKLVKLNRYGGSSTGGIAVWDYNVSGMVTNAWTFKVDYSGRRSNCLASGWYVSFTGLGRTLDSTVVTNLATGSGATLVGNALNYVKIGELPADTAAGTYEWDLTDIVNAAATNGGGIRLVYYDNTYLDTGPSFLNDSGLIASNATAGAEVDMLPFYFSDTFSSTNGVLPLKGWTHDGAEAKEYNGTNYPGLLAIRDESTSNAWSSITMDFEDLKLENDGDWLELSVDLAYFEDVSGSAYTNTSSPVGIMTLTDSALTNNAGYGFRINQKQYSSINLFDAYDAWPTDFPDDETTREFTSTNTMQNWKMRIERAGTNLVISPLVDGVVFGGSTKMPSYTNSACVGVDFNRFYFSSRGNNIGVKIDNAYVLSNVKPVFLPPYTEWEAEKGVTGGKTGDDDGDGLNNYGEYVFGGDPVLPDGASDQGSQPVLDAAGNYTYYLVGDDSVVARVMARASLTTGDWEPIATNAVSVSDGELGTYMESVGTSGSQLFLKLDVD